MGLLDDAIRDHLELKRRRGADPTEIAREEREALEPVFPDEPRPPGFDEKPQAAPVLDEERPQGDPLHDAAALAEGTEAVAGPGFSEETAELDMQAVLDEQDAAEAQAAGEQATAVALDGAVAPEPVSAPRPSDDELLEWETPERGAQDDRPPQPLPGQERMSFE